MSTVTGLVGNEVADSQDATSTYHEWAVRHAWPLILTGSFAFWLSLAVLLVWL